MRAAHRTVRAAVAAAAGLTLALSGLTPAAHAATLAADVACTGAPGSATCAFDLYAKASDPIALNASTNVTFWSYALTNGGPAAAVGPTLVVHRGDAVTLTVHNDLPNTTVSERTSLAIPQLNDFPQAFVGIARGDQGTYSFTASRSGTFLYEAGPTEDGPRQVSLGMVGALVVLETGADAGTAYGTPGSAYDDEGVVLLSEVDPRLHASPAGFDMRLFTPQFRLMNGLDHPNVPRIGATPGGRLLLRIVNGGVQQHALGVLGVRQRVIAVSGRPLSNPYDVVSETVAPGDVLDTVIDLPTTQGALYPLFEPEGRLDNGGERAANGTVLTGGMLTLIDTGTGGADPAPTATVTVNAPKRVKPGTGITFNATVTDNTSVAAAEYVLDNQSATPGCATCVALPVTPGSASVTFTNVAVDTTGLPFGTHSVLVRGQDDTGRWGALASATFTVDDRGPIVSSMALDGLSSGGLEQFATNGSQPIAVTASATELGAGGGTVQSGAVSVDSGAATTFPAAGTLTVALQTTLSAGTVNALPEGSHTVGLTATDDLGNTGSPASQTFVVDKTAPTSSNVAASPSPNNGQNGIPLDATVFEVTATVADPVGGGVSSGVTAGETWVGATRYPMTLTGPSTLRGTIPLSQLSALSDGTVTVNVRSRDRAGNWGAAATGALVLDRTAPAVTGLTASGTGTVTITGSASDAGTGVAAAEYYVDVDPGKGAGTPISVTAGPTAPISFAANTATWTNGPHTVFVRARDAAGNWTTPATGVTVTVSAGGPIFTDGFEGATIVPPWSAQVRQNGGTLSLVSGASALVGNQSLNVGLGGRARAYVTDTRPSSETKYSASFQLRTNALATGNRTLDVFVGRSSAGTKAFRVQLRTSGGVQQMRVLVVRSGGTTATAWTPLSALVTGHAVSVSWSSASNAVVTLTVDSTTESTGAIDTTGNSIDTVWLGASAGTGNGVTGSLTYDAFTSSRA